MDLSLGLCLCPLLMGVISPAAAPAPVSLTWTDATGTPVFLAWDALGGGEALLDWDEQAAADTRSIGWSDSSDLLVSLAWDGPTATLQDLIWSINP